MKMITHNFTHDFLEEYDISSMDEMLTFLAHEKGKLVLIQCSRKANLEMLFNTMQRSASQRIQVIGSIKELIGSIGVKQDGVFVLFREQLNDLQALKEICDRFNRSVIVLHQIKAQREIVFYKQKILRFKVPDSLKPYIDIMGWLSQPEYAGITEDVLGISVKNKVYLHWLVGYLWPKTTIFELSNGKEYFCVSKP